MQALKKHLLEYVESITEKRGSMYVCPICNSGNGRRKTAAFSVFGANNEKWQCKSGNCTEAGQRGGDIYDLIGIIEHIPDVASRAERVRQMFGYQRTYSAPVAKPKAEKMLSIQPGKLQDYTKQFKEWNKNLENCTYRRGISKETLDRFNVGYCENWINPANPTAKASPRLIVPLSAHGYLARSTDNNKHSKIKAGQLSIFNVKALAENEPIFICEGELDALSVIDAGGQAVALSGATNWRRLIEPLKQYKPAYPLIFALDADTAGKNATESLSKVLDELGIEYCSMDFSQDGKYTDVNEVLMKTDIMHLMQIVGKAKEQALTIARADFEAKKAEFLNTSVFSDMDNFNLAVEDSKTRPAVPSGFHGLDRVLMGGFRAGFYVLGAVSGLGKTTLAVQIADNMAKFGRDVLIISLEMARHELMARSMSRESYLYVQEKGYEDYYAKSELGISEGYWYENYSPRNIEVIEAAKERYKEYNKRLFVHEGVGNIGVDKVREIMEKHFYFTGTYPVLIVDFLQILAPTDVRMTDKQNTDKAVLELKRMSRDFKTPVIAISSFNRQSYEDDVKTSSFKESGGIEYTADALFGLQTAKTDASPVPDVKKGADRYEVRNIELHVLKNRKGISSSKKRKIVINFEYLPTFNHFKDVSKQQEDWTT